MITARRGYHFSVEARTCIECHKEHLGRDAATYIFSKKTFQHAQTGFPIGGKHAVLECESCHNTKFIADPDVKRLLADHPHQTYLGVSPACTSCHQNPHDQAQQQRCLTCHTDAGWNAIKKFDHSMTRFVLLGKHRMVECKQCHVSLTQKNRDAVRDFTVRNFTECQACHASPHTGKLQHQNCTSCHSEDGWNKPGPKKFDHAVTGFVLSGRHAAIACEKCHKTNPGASFSSTFLLRHRSCTDCHEDYHHGEFSERYDNDCSTCHTTLRWSPSSFTVAHHNQTNYPLTGSHVAVACQTCHPKKYLPTGQFHFKNLECEGCHKNIHGENFTAAWYSQGCRTCHTTQAWNAVRFDHGVTKFSLAAGHASIGCVACHKPVTGHGTATIPFRGLGTFCEGCHKDFHAGQFAVAGSTDCQRCHAPTRWTDSKFDHQRQSSFSLTGAHKNLACDRCHRTENSAGIAVVHYKPLSGECESCHTGRGGL